MSENRLMLWIGIILASCSNSEIGILIGVIITIIFIVFNLIDIIYGNK